MEPSDFIEFFRYATLLCERMTKNHETAWLSLKDTRLHIVWAEDSWINY